ncbi:unnamed protein product, partial [Closterium sp. Naga37s-1]
ESLLLCSHLLTTPARDWRPTAHMGRWQAGRTRGSNGCSQHKCHCSSAITRLLLLWLRMDSQYDWAPHLLLLLRLVLHGLAPLRRDGAQLTHAEAADVAEACERLQARLHYAPTSASPQDHFPSFLPFPQLQPCFAHIPPPCIRVTNALKPSFPQLPPSASHLLLLYPLLAHSSAARHPPLPQPQVRSHLCPTAVPCLPIPSPFPPFSIHPPALHCTCCSILPTSGLRICGLMVCGRPHSSRLTHALSLLLPFPPPPTLPQSFRQLHTAPASAALVDGLRSPTADVAEVGDRRWRQQWRQQWQWRGARGGGWEGGRRGGERRLLMGLDKLEVAKVTRSEGWICVRDSLERKGGRRAPHLLLLHQLTDSSTPVGAGALFTGNLWAADVAEECERWGAAVCPVATLLSQTSNGAGVLFGFGWCSSGLFDTL